MRAFPALASAAYGPAGASSRLLLQRRCGSTVAAAPRVKRSKKVSCEECFFASRGLCALELDEPCTTFRPAERGLAPERQLAFVFRADGTKQRLPALDPPLGMVDDAPRR